MASVQRSVIVLIAVLGLLASLTQPALAAAQQSQQPPPAAKKLSPAEVDKLVAPIALYPDQLLVQILMCSTSPFQVRAVNDWLKKNQKLKGSALQEAAQKEGFDPSYVALTMFPQVVRMMAAQLDWTKQLGEAFQSDRKAVLDSAQRLRSQAMNVGNLKDTPQQDVSMQKTPDGTQVIVIQPANPEVVYVPQYNPQVVYTQPPPAQTQPTVVVVEDDDDNEGAAAAIGFTAGVIVGSWATPYWGWGPYPYGGAGYWYNDAWDDFYDHREDMWEDYLEHGGPEQRAERQQNRQENRDQRQGDRDQRRTDRQGERDQRQTDRQGDRDQRQTDRQGTRDQRQTDRGGSRTAERGSLQDRSRPSNLDSRGYGGGGRQASRGGSSGRGGGFSGYGSGSSSRASSSRGRSSMGGGGGGRSRGGGGRRR